MFFFLFLVFFLYPLKNDCLVFKVDRSVVTETSEENLNNKQTFDALLFIHLYRHFLYVQLGLQVIVNILSFVCNRLRKHCMNLYFVHVEDFFKLFVLLVFSIGIGFA